VGHASQLRKNEIVLRLKNDWDALWQAFLVFLGRIDNRSVNLNLVSLDVIIFVNNAFVSLLNTKRTDQVDSTVKHDKRVYI
jgi:hypothetical protein